MKNEKRKLAFRAEHETEDYKNVNMVIHDTRNCCGITREDYEEFLKANPIMSYREIHIPSRFGSNLDSVYDKWRKQTADKMTYNLIQAIKYSDVNYPLVIMGSVEIDGKRYPVKHKLVESVGETVTGSERPRVHYKQSSLYVAITTCLSGKDILDFTLRYMSGVMTICVYHTRGMNFFTIAKMRPSRMKRIPNGIEAISESHIMDDYIGVIKLHELDFI